MVRVCTVNVTESHVHSCPHSVAIYACISQKSNVYYCLQLSYTSFSLHFLFIRTGAHRSCSTIIFFLFSIVFVSLFLFVLFFFTIFDFFFAFLSYGFFSPFSPFHHLSSTQQTHNKMCY